MVIILGAVFTVLDMPTADLLSEDTAAAPPMGLFLLAGVIDTVVNFLVVALGASILVDVYRRLVLRRRVRPHPALRSGRRPAPIGHYLCNAPENTLIILDI